MFFFLLMFMFGLIMMFWLNLGMWKINFFLLFLSLNFGNFGGMVVYLLLLVKIWKIKRKRK